MKTEVELPMERDTWNSYPGSFTFTINDVGAETECVEMEIVEYDYDKDRKARVISFTKEDFLKLLRIVQL
jgi:hypothetical protein